MSRLPTRLDRPALGADPQSRPSCGWLSLPAMRQGRTRNSSIGPDQNLLIIKGYFHKLRAVLRLDCDFHTPKQDVKEEVSDAAQADHGESGE